MYKLIFSFLLLFSLASCIGKGEKVPLINTGKFEVGQTYIYDYGDAKYEVKCLTDSTLHWKCIEGEELGKEETDKYYKQELEGNSVFLTWAEADGIGVSQIIDFNKNTVKLYLKIDKQIEIAEAKISKK